MRKKFYPLPKKESMEGMLKDFPLGLSSELKNQSLEGALAKMSEREREIIERNVILLSRIHGLGRLGALSLLAAVGVALENEGPHRGVQ